MRFDDLILELRSAAATLRTPTGSFLPAQDRITAELLERAADAMAAPPTEPEIFSFDPTDARASVTVRWPDGAHLAYDLNQSKYTDNQPAGSIKIGGRPLTPEQAADILRQVERGGLS